MILSFKPEFKGKIINGQKIHTIRYDKNYRWRPGMKIHFATGARTKLYNQFWYGHCKSIQNISIERRVASNHIISSRVEIDSCLLTPAELASLASQDGFEDNINAFLEFFISKKHLYASLCEDRELYGANEMSLTYVARLIHWTNFRY